MLGWLRRLWGQPELKRVPSSLPSQPPFPPEFVAKELTKPELRCVITVTPAAVEAIRRAATATGLYRWVIRVQLAVTAFEGIRPVAFQDRVTFDTEVDPETDFLDESQGVPVVIDRRTATYMGSGVIETASLGGGIKLRWPA